MEISYTSLSKGGCIREEDQSHNHGHNAMWGVTNVGR